MTIRALAAAAALTVAVGACAGERDRLRAEPGPASAEFDARELVDVLRPNAIPALNDPAFVTAGQAAEWLGDEQPVVVVEIAGDARAYPLAILLWHEIVNDTVGGRAVTVTYSPLSNSAVAFDRTVAGKPQRFAVSGKLYRSGLVMYDRLTSSLWPQLSGRAELGPLTGGELAEIPTQVSSFADFRASFPAGTVLSHETGVTRGYGLSPYDGYDSRSEPTSFFALRPDRRRGVMDRVVGIRSASGGRAYPYTRLQQAGVTYDGAGPQEVVLFWRAGTRSALDTTVIARARDVGSVGVFRPVVDGRRLGFAPTAEGFRDAQTGSTWTVVGVATAGPLKGKRLQIVPHVDAFWFAWAAFQPLTSIFGE